MEATRQVGANQTKKFLACIWWSIQFGTLAKYTNRSTDVTPQDLQATFRGTLIAYPFWCVGMCCIKSSVLLTLLRIKDSRWWRILLWALIVMQVVYTVGDVIAEWVFFKTLTSLSCAESVDDPCSIIFTVTNLVEGSFPLATDIVISLLPIAFLVQLQRPLSEKFLIAGLMSLGLVASIFSVLKMVHNTQFDPNQSLADLTISFYTYSSGELFIGIIAGCLFSLKSGFYDLPGSFGIDIAGKINPQAQKPDDLPDFNIPSDGNISSKSMSS